MGLSTTLNDAVTKLMNLVTTLEMYDRRDSPEDLAQVIEDAITEIEIVINELE